MTPLDPDPLEIRHHPAYVVGYNDGWDDAPLRRPESHRPPLDRVLVSLALAVFLLLGIAIGRVSATPRPAQTTERFDVSPLSSAGPIGAPQLAIPAGTKGSGVHGDATPSGNPARGASR